MQNKSNKKLTLCQALRLVQDTEKLFERAANAWVAGSNSGDNEVMRRKNALCDTLRRSAEAALEPLGIECDYPGLYPSFKVKGFHYYEVLTAVSAALDEENV